MQLATPCGAGPAGASRLLALGAARGELRGADWRSYIGSLLDRSQRVSPAALQQAATRAIERGFFDDAEKLLKRGLAEAPDNIFLRTTEARLFHERGRFEEALRCFDTIFAELADAREAEAVWLTRLESALERFRETGNPNVLPVHRPHPLRGTPPKDDRTLHYRLYLLAAEAKLYWYGAETCNYSSDLRALANALLAVEDVPFLRNLAARILADDRVRDWEKARQHVQAALQNATGQQRLRSLDLLASIWEKQAKVADESQANLCRQNAINALMESLKIDPENTFTLAALTRLQQALSGK